MNGDGKEEDENVDSSDEEDEDEDDSDGDMEVDEDFKAELKSALGESAIISEDEDVSKYST